MGRTAGPFREPPFPNFRTSPIALIPKKAAGEFRLIQNLSAPQGNSVNTYIPQDKATVQYQTLQDAIKLLQKIGRGTLMVKTDIESAFRLIPVHPEDYHLLGFQWDGAFYYEKVMVMGCRSSCQIFEKFSSALHWIMEHKYTARGVVHILDDFFFTGIPNSTDCARDLSNFLQMCEETHIPIKNEKTVHPTTKIEFLGVTLDSVQQVAQMPADKVTKILNKINEFLKRKKVTLKELQQLLGLLNFACAVVAPGRAFLRRLHDLTRGIQKPHHHRRLGKPAKADLEAWKSFIVNFNGKSMILDMKWLQAQKLELYTDASSKGFGIVFQTKWAYGHWPSSWIEEKHINVKEVFPIVLAIELFAEQLQNKCIIFHLDNQTAVAGVNNMTSREPDIMHCLRRLVIVTMQQNILCKAEYIPGKINILADHLSRFKIDLFKQAAPWADREPRSIPPGLMPAS